MKASDKDERLMTKKFFSFLKNTILVTCLGASVGTMLGKEIASLDVGTSFLARKAYVLVMQEKNPFVHQVITPEETSASSLLMSAIAENAFLEEAEKEVIYSMKNYLQENPYLDYKKVYDRFQLLDVHDLGSEFAPKANILGVCQTNQASINLYRDSQVPLEQNEEKKLDLVHEVMHLTGYLENQCLNEGMTSLLVSEYFTEGLIVDGYGIDQVITKMFCELVGSDTILEAYAKQNDALIQDRMLTLGFSKEQIELLFQQMSVIHEKVIAQEDANSELQTFQMTMLVGLEQMKCDFSSDSFMRIISYLETLSTKELTVEEAYFSRNYQNRLASSSYQNTSRS